MIERGPYISFANCGLPYHISGIIAERDSLLVTSEALFEARYAVDVRSRFLGLPYGDQALFVRREAYDLLGGMAPFPLMEDVNLVKRLKALGPKCNWVPRVVWAGPEAKKRGRECRGGGAMQRMISGRPPSSSAPWRPRKASER